MDARRSFDCPDQSDFAGGAQQRSRFDGYKQAVNRLLNDPGVLATAEKEGRDPEEVAAFVIARDTWLTTRRDLLAEGAKAQGRSVAEVAYEEAVDRGWNSKGASQDEQNVAAEAARPV